MKKSFPVLLIIFVLCCVVTLASCIRGEKPHTHTEQIIPATSSTCTQAGFSEGVKCSSCDEILIAQELIPMLEHDYSIEAVIDSTCSEQGYTKHACACGAYYKDNYTDLIDHDYGAWYMYRDETTPVEGEGRRDCQREEQPSE